MERKKAPPSPQPDGTRPEALFIRTPDGIVLTDAGRADVRQALAEYLASCEIPQGEWPEIWERAKARGGSNLDLEREVQRWLMDQGRVMVSATSPYFSDETLTRVARRFRRKPIGDDRLNAHLDRLDQRDAQKGAIPPEPQVYLTEEESAILGALAEVHPKLLTQQQIVGTGLDVSPRTIQTRLPILVSKGLVCRPEGKRSGWGLTDRGLKIIKPAK